MTERTLAWVEPAVAFEALFAAAAHSFWLDRGPDAVSGTSVMGAAAREASIVTASVAAGTVRQMDAAGTRGTVREETVLEFLRRECVRRQASAADEAFVPAWIGWIGYEAGAAACGVPTSPSRYADAAFLYADRAVTFDHGARTLTVSVPVGEEDELENVCVALSALRDAPPREPVPPSVRPGRWRHNRDDYLALIAHCRHSISHGDAYQLCLTNELVSEHAPDPLETYLALRRASPTGRGAFLRIDGTALLSASPEQFLDVGQDGTVVTRPIKGTRPRAADPIEDERLRQELLDSAKERAENLMIVDLMRNDLSRVAELGTVAVSDLLSVESYAQVHQLVSTVRARLRTGNSAVDAVSACFPAGSMTGAPKLSAMRSVHELESGPRGIYSGCFGRFGTDGTAALSMVIRSIVIDDHGVSIGAGGGIMAESDPAAEWAEVAVKASILAHAAGVTSNLDP